MTMWFIILALIVPIVLTVLILKAVLWFSDSKGHKIDVHRMTQAFFLMGLAITLGASITAFKFEPKMQTNFLEPVIHEDWNDLIEIGSHIEVKEKKVAPKPVVKKVTTPVVKTEKPEMKPIEKPKPSKAEVVNIVTETTPEPVIETISTTESFETTVEEVITASPVETTISEPVTSFESSSSTVAETSKSPFANRPGANRTPVDKNSKVLNQAEMMPMFPGGPVALKQFIEENYIFGNDCFDNNIEGTVGVSFVVNLDGSLTEITLSKGLGCTVDENAVNLVEEMPNWIPAFHKGNYVRVRVVLPIEISIG